MVSATDKTVASAQELPTLPSTREPEPPAKPLEIGRYIVLDRLGSGGMGVVYAAYDPELDRKIALKVLHRPERPDAHRVKGAVMNRLFGDPAATEAAERRPDQGRLLREAQAAARINDPHVVTVHDVGQHDGAVFIAMEYVQGRTLGQWFREAKRSWHEVVAVMLKAGAGLVAAHEKGLVHRDFKPDNVMIDAANRVRVMDFGLVRGSEDTTTSEHRPTTDALRMDLTHEGAVMGTPAYMSPEQHLGRDVGPASDQFSFCVTLWEGVYGQRPFPGTSVASIAAAVAQGKRRDPPASSDVPPRIRRVLERGLAVDPSDRHPSMRVLLAELERDPTRRRTFLVLGGAVALFGAAAVTSYRAERAHAIAQCEAEGATVDAIWNSEARARIDAAITGSGAPYAAATIERVHPWLDAFARDWTTMRVEACTSARLADDALAEQTLACLDDRWRVFQTSIALLGEPDPDSARRAVQLAAALPRLSACIDPQALARRPTLPSDPELRARVVEVNEQLHRVSFLESSGDYEEGHEVALAALAQAQSIGRPDLVARTRYRAGVMSERAGDYEAAERELAAAALEHAELGRDDDAAEAAMRLAVVLVLRQGRTDEGLVWARWAEALVVRADAEDGLLGANLHNELGLIDHHRGAYDEALRHFERSLEIKERELGSEHPTVALAISNLGSLQSTRGEYDAALRLFERAREGFEATLGPDHPDTAMPLVNASEIHWREGRLDQAMAAMRRGLAIHEGAFGPKHPRVAQSVGNVGALLNAQGRFDEALAMNERAVAIAEASLGSDSPVIAPMLGNLGDTQRELGRHEEALATHRRALELHEKLGPARIEVAEVLSSIGDDQRALGRRSEALASQRRALQIVEAAAGPKHPHVAEIQKRIDQIEAELAR